ncbi:hypothetical protein [uncultured Ruegeria sp.]|nr:hypothetical protein [uncultured Ruegeria sp.]
MSRPQLGCYLERKISMDNSFRDFPAFGGVQWILNGWYATD